jgi:hypothetical protein
MTKSQNGWQTSIDRAAIGVKNYLVPNTHAHLAVATGAAPLLITFAQYFNDHVEKLDGATWDDWGYGVGDNRGIAAMLSNHASGTAIDLNAVKHPMGKVNTFTSAQAALIRTECARLGLRWGGDYKSTKDEMHVEINITPAAAAALIKTLKLPMPKVKGN